jgi:hypothetical protein
MSEINSIANGSFVLGQTSATNFVGGTGITVDSPSEGTVRISNDETVLWSGSTTASGDIMNLSEPFTNFERVRVKSNAWERYFYNDIACTAAKLDFGNIWCLGNGTNVQYVVHSYSANNARDKLVWQASNTAYLPDVGTKSWSTAYQIKEVVGINRISGSNA